MRIAFDLDDTLLPCGRSVMDLRAARAFLEHETANSVLGGAMKHPNGGIHKDWWHNLDFGDRLAFAEAIGRYRRARGQRAGLTMTESAIG